MVAIRNVSAAEALVLGIITGLARQLDCPTPLFAPTSAVYTAAMAQGFAEADTASVCAAPESWANSRRRSQ
jgi:3-hydroxyisobutyrate dehydrogenase-like beta-hydroxyacid dehydrogenase